MHVSKKELEHEHSHNHLSTDRIEALSDAAFAIVMTILAIELRIPEVTANLVSKELFPALLSLWPSVFSYFMSFIVLGVFWVHHHKQFNYIEVTDRALIWINIVFLMFVAMIPFSTAFLGRYIGESIAAILYASHLAIIGTILFIHWWYATKDCHLVEDNISRELVKKAKKRLLFGPKFFLVSIAAAFFSSTISLLLIVVVIIYYLLPGPLDKFWKKEEIEHIIQNL